MQRYTGKVGLLALASAAGMAHGQQVLIVPDNLTMTQALSVAAPGDTIEIRGTIGVEQTFVITQSGLTIRGLGGVVNTNGFTRAFQADGVEGLRIENLTITGGNNFFVDRVVDAAGMFFSNGSATLENVTFRNLRATRDAGAFFATNSSIELRNCTFENNQAEDDGGAAVLVGSVAMIIGGSFVNNLTTGENSSQPGRLGGALLISDDGADVKIDGTRFEGNRGFDPGGAIAAVGADRLEIVDARFINNGGTGDGGAVWMSAGGDLVVSDTWFEGNFVSSVNREGGALGADGGVNVDISGCTFLKNRSEDFDGGAVWFVNDCTGVLSDNEFRHNTAGRNGGAMAMRGTRPILQQRNYYLGNRCVEFGGGVWLLGETPAGGGESNLYDCVFVGNTAGNGAALLTESGPDNQLVNCTIVMNTALDEGGAAYSIFGTNTLAGFRGVIMQGNTAAVDIPGITNPTLLFTYSNVQGLAGSPWDTPQNVNIDADPMFVEEPDDGGDGFGDDPDTEDVDESLNDFFGDLRLSEGSPSIDAGDTAERLRPEPLPFLNGTSLARELFNPTSIFNPTDAGGAARVVTVNGYDPLVDLGVPLLNNVIDHGAFEFQPVAVVALPGCNIADLSDTPPGSGTFGQLDGNDIGAFVSAFLNGCPPQ